MDTCGFVLLPFNPEKSGLHYVEHFGYYSGKQSTRQLQYLFLTVNLRIVYGTIHNLVDTEAKKGIKYRTYWIFYQLT